MSVTGTVELLEAVRRFLREELVPTLEGYQAYTTRVAANNLAIVERQIALAPQLDELDRGIALELGLDSTSGRVAQRIALALRDGELAPDQRLLDYLRERTLKCLEIDNPRYSGYLQARKRWQGET